MVTVDIVTPDKIEVSGKRVLVRADLDVDVNGFEDDLRVKALTQTLDYLKSSGCAITIIAHKGRPDGKVDPALSLKPLEGYFQRWSAVVFENLRFDPGEETNDVEFAKRLASMGDVFVNEAFASSHRAHASIVGLPKLLPSCFGFHFAKEVENLSRVIDNPKRPLIVLISGVKEDKIPYITHFSNLADKVLVAGRLPDFIDLSEQTDEMERSGKVIVARLLPDKEDITIHSIEKFIEEIEKASTIVVSGPLGKYEEEGHRMGTERVFNAVAKANAFKVAGGGDTEAALKLLGLTEQFNWISVGGGAMLEFLTDGKLAGLDAVLSHA